MESHARLLFNGVAGTCNDKLDKFMPKHLSKKVLFRTFDEITDQYEYRLWYIIIFHVRRNDK